MKLVYLNGNYCSAPDAKISIFDRGLLFGDGVYEVIPVYHRKVCFLDQHIQRLEQSLRQARIRLPHLDWQKVFQPLIDAEPVPHFQIYLQITRGNQGARKHDIPDELEPSLIAFSLNTPYPELHQQEKGMSAVLLEDYRWLRCNIKTTSLLANILLNDEAMGAGGQTALLHRQGFLTEGATANVFIINQQGRVQTPPADNLILAGITRALTLSILKDLGKAAEEVAIPVDQVLSAQEIWITSTTKEVYPISQLNGQQVGTGKPGELWYEVHKRFSKLTGRIA